MNRDRAIVQIGDLMRQAGIPAGHAADIVERLRLASSAQTAKESRLITSGQARNSAFANLYKAPEQEETDSLAGRAGKDGLAGAAGWGEQGPAGEGVPGPPGQNGVDGQSPDAGALAALITGLINAALGRLSVDLDKTSCKSFKSKFKDCITAADIPGGGGGGQAGCAQFGGLSPCDVLKQQAGRMGNCGRDDRTFCERLKDLDKRMAAVEKAIDQDTVEC